MEATCSNGLLCPSNLANGDGLKFFGRAPPISHLRGVRDPTFLVHSLYMFFAGTTGYDEHYPPRFVYGDEGHP